jgi:hypothetical protein
MLERWEREARKEEPWNGVAAVVKGSGDGGAKGKGNEMGNGRGGGTWSLGYLDGSE